VGRSKLWRHFYDRHDNSDARKYVYSTGHYSAATKILFVQKVLLAETKKYYYSLVKWNIETVIIFWDVVLPDSLGHFLPAWTPSLSNAYNTTFGQKISKLDLLGWNRTFTCEINLNIEVGFGNSLLTGCRLCANQMKHLSVFANFNLLHSFKRQEPSIISCYISSCLYYKLLKSQVSNHIWVDETLPSA
jgi:hypothetical protein